MKAAPFEYIGATSLDEAFAALSRHGDDALILAGGQSLMPILNMRLAAPQVLVDINGIGELTGIARHDDQLRIGALTRHRDLLRAEEVAQHTPLLRIAARQIAHPAIRNRGTIGGSLSHADPAAELPACALASGATINIRSAGGERRLPAEDFFLGVFETALQPGEIVTSVDIPVMQDGDACAFKEVARRQGDYAMAGLAAQATLDGDTVQGLRLAYFSIADRPVLARNAMAALDGQAWSDASAQAADAALDSDLTGVAGDLHTSAEAKRHLARVLLRRVMAKLTGGDA